MGFESSNDLFTDCSILKQFSVQFGKERTVYILEFLNMILFEGASSRPLGLAQFGTMVVRAKNLVPRDRYPRLMGSVQTVC